MALFIFSGGRVAVGAVALACDVVAVAVFARALALFIFSGGRVAVGAVALACDVVAVAVFARALALFIFSGGRVAVGADVNAVFARATITNIVGGLY